jgi:HD-like signal output (HDOD) protein
MMRILFVDDEAPVLESLRTLLHRMRARWEMNFVDSAGRAIESFEKAPHDILVTDIRMPGMDGAQLMQVISQRWPDTVRIALSGFAELKQSMRLVPLAHQFLSKPCQPQQLENVINRCVQLRDMLRAPALRAAVGRLQRLPTLPTTYAKLQPILAQEDASASDVAKVIACDSILVAKVLQMVNSAFFRLPRQVNKIEHAVTYLGFSAVRNLVLSAEVFAGWSHPTTDAVLDLERLQVHLQSVAVASHALTTYLPISDDSLLAGLLHDIGYWVLAQQCPEELKAALELAIARGIPMSEAEFELIGASHAEIGAYLLGIWGLPYGIVEAVAHHHAPERVTQTEFDVLAALSVASALTDPDQLDPFQRQPPPERRVEAQYLKAVAAPFDWSEAQRRATENLESRG